jgi:WD40 repeat protein
MGRPAVHPSGSFLVVPYPERRELVVVNTNSMTPSFTFTVPSQPTSLCFSAALPDTLHVGCSDGHVRTFTISTSADQIHDFSVGPSTVSILSLTATNTYLVVSSSDGFVTLWDSKQFTCVQSIAADRSEPALQSVITADERWIVTRTEDANAVEIAHSRFGAVVMRSECPFTIMALAMHATQPAFAVAGNMREVGGGGTRSRKAGLMLYSILVKGYRPTK